MDFFGIGPAELVLILVVVLMVFGPDQLPEVAKKMGKLTRDLRRSLNDISSEVDETIKPFKEMTNDIKELENIDPFVLAKASSTEAQPEAEVNSQPPPPVEELAASESTEPSPLESSEHPHPEEPPLPNSTAPTRPDSFELALPDSTEPVSESSPEK